MCVSASLPGLKCTSTDTPGSASGLVDEMQCFRFNEKSQTFDYWVSCVLGVHGCFVIFMLVVLGQCSIKLGCSVQIEPA